ncbi:MAG: tRNA uridine-5-carboxymethylaminomethyl(34) synthesis GTPase MnmE [Lentisphaeria bacterium]|nr:tRNA uridine-5-carboxymethylaminomethyl(34) synthesis GTPase MnmE [Lentisphaeria bacterium]
MRYDALDQDTIASLCTAPGGALAIIRISGPLALECGNKVWKGRKKLGPENVRQMLLGEVSGGEHCLAVFMQQPNSYTGEDTVELHCHGGTFAPRRLLDAVLRSGARSAGPGEFTKRAFLNGKMDLTQAEAVADLIHAKSERAALLAGKQMSGMLGNGIRSLRQTLLTLQLEAESRLDFPEEDLDWKSPQECLELLQGVEQELEKMIRSAVNGSVLRSGVHVVIAGRPNAGKSSLLNALLGYERAIVTPVAGTTRDTLEEYVSLRDIPVRLTDTAGIRENSADPVEKIGIDRSIHTLEEADMIFWVLDGSHPENAKEEAAFLKDQLSGRQKQCVLALWNKMDLNISGEKLPDLPEGIVALQISARTGTGLEELLDRFAEKIWDNSGSGTGGESSCEVSARHEVLLREALSCIREAAEKVRSGEWELAALNLREALASLGTVTGEEVSADVLEGIFRNFCIGK